MYNRGTKYLNKNNYAKALQFLKKEPLDFKEKYLNMGNCYRGLGNLDRAIECYLKANSPSMPMANGSHIPEYTLALNNLGLASYMLGSDSTALELYTRALAIDPLYYECLWNYANAYLRSGFSGADIDWNKAWSMYGYRFKRANGAVPIDSRIPLWDGVTKHDSIVVLAEQGYGDKFMFSRYINLLKPYFNRIVIECKPDLDYFYSEYEIVRSGYMAADVGVPICSLPSIFYHYFPPHNWIKHEKIVNNFPISRAKIGIVYSGSPTHANNHNRSTTLSSMLCLRDLGDLYSLTPGARVTSGIVPMATTSWEETTALVSSLDLVISVDTSIVHLAGCLDVPCIMIQPLCETDFRWGVGQTTTPWYPSVRIVSNNNWDTAIGKAKLLAIEMLADIRDARLKNFIEDCNVQNN